jgi:5-methylcytosine-specific restriction endonuclease McrA
MLDTAVLVLNRVYQPIHVTSVRRAVSLLYQGVARAIDDEFRLLDFEGWAELAAASEDAIHTPTRAIRVPRVVVLVAHAHLPHHRVRFSRLNVYARDESACQYCGRRRARSELNLDHVIPRSRGGSTSWENVVCSCVACNLRKGGRTPEEAGMRLLRQPSRPRWTAVFRAAARRAIHRQWIPFLGLVDAAYWNVELRD